MGNATFTAPDLASFTGLDTLGLAVIGQRLTSKRAVLACRVVAADDWCHECGCRGEPRDTVVRRLAHAPFGWRPTVLEVTVRRYRCGICNRVWRQDMTLAAEPRSKISRAGLAWALAGLVVEHLTVARVAECLDVAWNTANQAVLDEGRRVLLDDPQRFANVHVIGVDEHVWRHGRHGEKYVTVIIDLTPVRENAGPARLLDMVEGRSKQAFKQWLAARPQTWRDGIEIVAMDGFAGFKTAAAEELPQAIEVMDPFHVVALAGDALEKTRQRVQQETLGHRGRTGDPLFAARRILQTGTDLLTTWQQHKLDVLFADDAHVGVEVTWGVYQQAVAAYRSIDKARSAKMLNRLITAISHNVPPPLIEVRKCHLVTAA